MAVTGVGGVPIWGQVGFIESLALMTLSPIQRLSNSDLVLQPSGGNYSNNGRV